MSVIRVAAPATTANLGPGYDCLGMALDIWNTVEVEPLPSGGTPSVSITGEGAGELEEDTGNLVYRSMEFLFRELGRPMPAVGVRCENEIPLARGLGSSAAAIAGGTGCGQRPGWRRVCGPRPAGDGGHHRGPPRQRRRRRDGRPAAGRHRGEHPVHRAGQRSG